MKKCNFEIFFVVSTQECVFAEKARRVCWNSRGDSIVLVNWAVCWFPASPSWAASRFSILSDSAPTLFFLPGRDSRIVDANIRMRIWDTHQHTPTHTRTCMSASRAQVGRNPQPWSQAGGGAEGCSVYCSDASGAADLQPLV